MSINPPGGNNSFPAPAAYSPLAIQGHSLQEGILTCNEGQWSYVSEVVRTQFQAKILNNFQMLTRGIWSCPTGIGWQPQRSGAFNSGAAFMDFGVFEDFLGNQTMLFQVGDQVYSYNLATQTETAYDAPLTGLSTSLANLPCMRSFVDTTGIVAPMTIYTNGDIQPVEITGTAAGDVAQLPFVGTPLVTAINPNGGQFDTSYPINTYTIGTMIANYAVTAASEPNQCCLGPDGNVWFCNANLADVSNISPTGVVTNYAVANTVGQCICVGSDGRIWVGYGGGVTTFSATTTVGITTPYAVHSSLTDCYGICSDGIANIYLIFGTSSEIQEYTAATGAYVTETAATHGPTSIVYGPDGRLWTTTGANGIQATTIGSTTTVYNTGLPAGASTGSIILGPAATMYFLVEPTNGNGNLIGSITIDGTITTYPVPNKAANVVGLCVGPDGNIWFTEIIPSTVSPFTQQDNIGRLNITTGIITEFTGPPANCDLSGIVTGSDNNLWFAESTASASAIGTMLVGSPSLRGAVTGPDGRIWFTEFGANKIGAITTLGVLTEYPLPNQGSGPFDICSDGTNLWFTEQIGNRIGMITTAGVIHETTVTTGGSGPSGICFNPHDGNVWFTEFNASKVAKITPGYVITEYATTTANAQPLGICAFNNLVYFCESAAAANNIATCTTVGVITEAPVPTSGAVPSWITSGSDGRLWFTEQAANKIGAVTTALIGFAEFIIPTAGSLPEQIVSASDGNLYFTEAAANKIGRVVPTTGAIVEFANITAAGEPFGITDGPDQSIWFTMSGASQIGNFLYGGSGSWPGVFQLTKKTYSKPLFNTEFNNRMAYFGFDPATNAALDVLISNQGSSSEFVTSVPVLATDAVSFTIPGLGLPTGLTSFRLTNTNNQEVLILGFQRGIAVVMGNGTTSDATTYQATILTKEYGLMSNRTFAQAQNDMYYLTTNGVRNFTNLTVNANLLNAALTFNMQDVIQSITTAPITGSNQLYNCQAFTVHHRNTLEMQFWFPTITDAVSSSYQNQHGIVMNYNVPTPVAQALTPIFSTKNGTAIACGIEFQGVMYGGGYDGILQQHYNGNTYNGNPIFGTMQLSLAASNNVQQSLELRQAIVIAEGGNQNFNVLTNFYTKMSNGTFIRTPSPEGSQILSSAVQGITTLGSTPLVDWTLNYSAFPSNHIKQIDFSATGEGPYMDFYITTNGPTQSLDFAGLAYTITVGGIRI